MNILILVSRHEHFSPLLKDKILADRSVKRYVLCPIHSGVDDSIIELERFIRSNTSAECAIVPFSRRLLEHSLKVKDDYIKYISQLGNREVSPGINLKEYFRYYSSDISLWWLSLVYEKSPGKTDAYLHFVKVSLIIALAQENHSGEVWMSSEGEDAKYFEVLSGVNKFTVMPIGPIQKSSGWMKDLFVLGRESLRVFRYFIFLLSVRLRTRGQKKPGLPENCKRFAITMFPFFDVKRFEERNFYSKAYGSLQDRLEADKDHPFVWLAMHTKIEPYTWQESYRLAGKAKEFTSNFFSVDDWIRLRDILRIGLDFLRFAVRLIGILNRLPGLTICNLGNNTNVNLWPFLHDDFISSFAGKVAVVNWHYLRIFLNITKGLPKDSTIIHFAEMHHWERSLQMASKLRGDIKVIALQHAHVPQLLLNYFDHRDDLMDENFMRSVPQPDSLGSVGAVIQDYFLKQGWPKEKLFIVGGFRFQSLSQKMDHQTNEAKEPPVLVAAFSICYNENLEMLKMLFKAFNDGAAGLKVMIKSHPAESIEKMSIKEGLALNKEAFEFTDTPLEEVVPHACAMFACSTSAVFYAMACRKPVIVPCLFDAVDLCPLTNLYPYETRIDSHQQLRSVVADIMQGRYDHSRHEKYWHHLFKDYLCLDKNDQERFENLNMYLKI